MREARGRSAGALPAAQTARHTREAALPRTALLGWPRCRVCFRVTSARGRRGPGTASGGQGLQSAERWSHALCRSCPLLPSNPSGRDAVPAAWKNGQVLLCRPVPSQGDSAAGTMRGRAYVPPSDPGWAGDRPRPCRLQCGHASRDGRDCSLLAPALGQFLPRTQGWAAARAPARSRGAVPWPDRDSRQTAHAGPRVGKRGSQCRAACLRGQHSTKAQTRAVSRAQGQAASETHHAGSVARRLVPPPAQLTPR